MYKIYGVTCPHCGEDNWDVICSGIGATHTCVSCGERFSIALVFMVSTMARLDQELELLPSNISYECEKVKENE